MILQGQPFLVVGIDNFGFVLIDGITKGVIETVNFADYIPVLGTFGFKIEKILPVGNNGIRVILKDDGAFSFVWRGLSKLHFNHQL
jgi:hypothetical protein